MKLNFLLYLLFVVGPLIAQVKQNSPKESKVEDGRVWTELFSDSISVQQPLFFVKYNSLILTFNRNELKRTIEEKVSSGEPLVKNMKVLDLTNIEDTIPPKQVGLKDVLHRLAENSNSDTMELDNVLVPFFLLKNNSFYAEYKGEFVDKVLIEDYETSFSGGVKYYFLNDQIDTLTIINLHIG
ncbi:MULTISPECIES: hypothetical protein [unclassified Lentimicrobium]|uniref:hypothetical protein n=1 Tax=unclassified Lentimicrobium TaxID=2677434 RepID=UPI0015532B3A|nr:MULTISPECIES: hypothetical protein [unclassified Lentimicrobium]NPD46827.1 hypothetical protein [Lentimicrobium sp. S6]NPD86493.1 hypothetical protein [Lentimicrobium sp. L6]